MRCKPEDLCDFLEESRRRFPGVFGLDDILLDGSKFLNL